MSRKEGKKKEGGRKSKQFLNCTAAHPDRNSASAQPMPKHRKFTKRMPLQHQTEPQHITQNKSHPHEVNLSRGCDLEKFCKAYLTRSSAKQFEE